MGAVTRCMHFVTASFYGGHMYIEGVKEVEVIRKRISACISMSDAAGMFS